MRRPPRGLEHPRPTCRHRLPGVARHSAYGLLALLTACGHAPPAVPAAEGAAVARPAPSRDTGEPALSHQASRALGPTATFGDLVDAARALDEAGTADSSAGCLLGGGGAVGAGWRLEANLAVAVRPLPEPTRGVATRVGPGAVRVLDRWGQHGEGPHELAIAVFTETPPPGREPILTLLVTPEGVYRRDTLGRAPRTGPIPVEDLDARLAAHDAGEHGLWVVTADADTPLARLRRVLAAIPPGAPAVALGTPFPEGTRLPEPPEGETATSTDDTGLCPNGLPAPEADAPTGDLEPATIVAALEPVRATARQCLEASPAPGGRIDIEFRVAPTGQVRHACARTDAAGDPILRSCLLDAVRALEVPPPDPAGLVDLSVPLVLEPDRSAAPPRPLCP